MTTRHDDNERETEIIQRPAPDHVDRVDRVERVEHVTETPASAAPGQVNVNANRYAQVWTVARVVTLFFTVLEVLLLARFVMKLLGANPDQALVAGLYGVTEPLTRPFQGIWPQTNTPVVFDLPALLAIVFFFLIAALVIALVRAISGNRTAA